MNAKRRWQKSVKTRDGTRFPMTRHICGSAVACKVFDLPNKPAASGVEHAGKKDAGIDAHSLDIVPAFLLPLLGMWAGGAFRPDPRGITRRSRWGSRWLAALVRVPCDADRSWCAREAVKRLKAGAMGQIRYPHFHPQEARFRAVDGFLPPGR